MEGDKHIHRVTGLDAGLQYLFRISAVNQAGSSPTVQTSNAVMTFGKYPVQCTNIPWRQLILTGEIS